MYVTVKCFQKCSYLLPPLSHPFTGQEGQLPRSCGSSVGFVCVVRGSGAWKAKAPLFPRSIREALSVRLPASIHPPVTHFNIPLSAGRFSPVLNTSGESSGGIAPTAGRYGSVRLCTRPRPCRNLRLIYPFKRYNHSLARACPSSHP